MVFGFGKNWDAKGKNCFVTGASQGLGLSASILLVKKGANVTIVARNVGKLKSAVEQLERHRISSEQTFRYHSFALNTSAGAQAALDAECRALRQQSDGTVSAPDAFFLCAGSSRPGYFIENTDEQLIHGMEQSYWVQAWSAHAAMQRLVREHRRGTIMFVGSTLSLMSFLGYASYTPGKHALKGLAETLRSEGILYGIDVHIFFAPTMDSPGLQEEMKTKPQLTAAFEADDTVLSCDEAAAVMLSAVERGNHHSAATFISKLFYNIGRGAAPVVNPVVGPVLDCIGWIALPFWRRDCDLKIFKSREKHQEYLKEVGFLSEAKKND
ncbi:oxidoreductase [Phellopilus nigrolimitatus]|nr:oxidoreductase [Phellopilus nigrolimitatus]